MSEAIRFPEDYDGIISSLPANNASVNEIAVWHLWRQTHDAAGKAIFTVGEMRTVSDATVDYRTPKEPAPFAGHTIADARLPESDIDGFLALAAERCPSFGEEGAQIAPFDCVNNPPLSSFFSIASLACFGIICAVNIERTAECIEVSGTPIAARSLVFGG